MLTLLMIQLQSFSRLVLVFLTAPLGIIGASLGLCPGPRIRGRCRQAKPVQSRASCT